MPDLPAPHRPVQTGCPAPLPIDEADRLAALHSYGILDTPPEERFDAITRLAAEICGMPVALVSLVDSDRQWCKSAVGIDVPVLPRDLSICAHALLDPGELLVVPDLALDPRFRDNPATSGAGVRSYAGAPLVGADGQPLGALCVLDVQPRTLDDRQLTALRTLARQVVAQLEFGRAERRLAEAERALSAATGRLRSVGPEAAGLVRALDRDELVVHYQPLFDVEVRGTALVARLSGAEALVRWQHPERGLLLPGEFVPAMEEQGLATRLGETVLRSAVTSLAAWEALLPRGFRLNVNISAQQLHEGGVPGLVDGLLEATGVRSGRLCLEITESALLDTASFTPDSAWELVERGLWLGLDDFGTGYSSLTQLRSYPFSCVKVDRSFVAGLGSCVQDEVIVDTVISLARGLGVTPVSEGVETAAQLAHVVAAGCTTVQGWLLGRATCAAHWESEVLRSAERLLPAVTAAPRRLGARIPVARAR